MLDRRTLLKYSALGTALAVTGPRLGLAQPQSAKAPAVGSDFPLEEATVGQLSDAMQRGAMTAVQITRLYLQRIQDIDRSGPRVNSVIEVNPEAEAIAAALDRERAAKGPRGPLHGIPILIKDNVGTGDRMLTSAGSMALADSPAAQDSSVAAKLRQAGAVILGKTNLSEWANFRSTRSSSGWSGRGGQTNNPYVLDRNPCGSSSGSGAAASANLCTLAIGTETDGSVVCPSNTNGLVGVKPTVGLVSRSGIVPISHTQDTAGPMARTVTDAAILLSALTGIDARDAATAASRGKAVADYAAGLDAGALKGARLGVVRSNFGFHERVDAVMDEALAALKSAGAELIDLENLGDAGNVGNDEFTVLLYEFKADLNSYLAGRGATTHYSTLEALIDFNSKHADVEMPYFRQEIFEQAQEKGPLTDDAYLEALENCRRSTRAAGIDWALQQHQLDALIAPTGGPAWVTDVINGDHFSGGTSTAAAVAGYPHVTVPAGYVYGLPVGLSFFGGAWNEARLLALAYAFEQQAGARRAPRFLATADLTPEAL